MSFSIRQASALDLDRLVPLFDGYRQFYGQPSDPQRARDFLAARLANEQSLILLACDDQGPALGFTQLYPLFSSVRTVRTYLLNDLFVSASVRRRGVAGALLRAAAEQARALGAASLSLATALDNAPAQALYESLGWQRDEQFCEYGLTL
ncbi:GNAT family N-acetyltransferase [Rhodanobacter sp. AS-Z3]|uniref:GNAT family N-acetyltransferase n=1 Tax=Rhodanobacter sp. AS-Z3 TaxID=3031330 RepID=UPI00247A3308|nr:GNAT family N-acetyltransferase [Rhodanobacter sp. AS-Z3]WEN16599.1 GNAT family N-acetyltransferase [Rhodanobacter sp. AS-Z3]